MPPFESLKLVSGLLQAQTPPNEPEELTKGKKDLSDILVALAEKEKEIEASQDSHERKSERYTKIAEVLKTQVLPVLQSWLTKYPEKKEGINKAIASIKALITKYEKKSEELETAAKQRAAVSEDVASGLKSDLPENLQNKNFYKDENGNLRRVYKEGIYKLTPNGALTYRDKTGFYFLGKGGDPDNMEQVTDVELEKKLPPNLREYGFFLDHEGKMRRKGFDGVYELQADKSLIFRGKKGLQKLPPKGNPGDETGRYYIDTNGIKDFPKMDWQSCEDETLQSDPNFPENLQNKKFYKDDKGNLRRKNEDGIFYIQKDGSIIYRDKKGVQKLKAGGRALTSADETESHEWEQANDEELEAELPENLKGKGFFWDDEGTIRRKGHDGVYTIVKNGELRFRNKEATQVLPVGADIDDPTKWQVLSQKAEPADVQKSAQNPAGIDLAREREQGFAQLYETSEIQVLLDQYSNEQKLEMLEEVSKSVEISEEQRRRILQAGIIKTALETIRTEIRDSGTLPETISQYLETESTTGVRLAYVESLMEPVDGLVEKIKQNPGMTIDQLLDPRVKKLLKAWSENKTLGALIFSTGQIKEARTEEELKKQYLALVEFLRFRQDYATAQTLVEETLLAPYFEQKRAEFDAKVKETIHKRIDAKVRGMITEKTRTKWTESGMTEEQQEEYIKALIEESEKKELNERIIEMRSEKPFDVGGTDRLIMESYVDMMGAGEWYDMADSTWDTIQEELIINAPLIIVSGGVASLARAGLSTGARAVIATGRFARIGLTIGETAEGVEKVIATGKAAKALLWGGRALGLLAEGTVFEAANSSLQGENLFASDFPEWGSRILWSSLALGAFHLSGEGAKQVKEIITKNLPKITNKAISAVTAKLLAAGTGKSIEAATMLMIGAVQHGVMEGNFEDWDLLDQILHSCVTVGALTIAGAGSKYIVAGTKKFSPTGPKEGGKAKPEQSKPEEPPSPPEPETPEARTKKAESYIGKKVFVERKDGAIEGGWEVVSVDDGDRLTLGKEGAGTKHARLDKLEATQKKAAEQGLKLEQVKVEPKEESFKEKAKRFFNSKLDKFRPGTKVYIVDGNAGAKPEGDWVVEEIKDKGNGEKTYVVVKEKNGLKYRKNASKEELEKWQEEGPAEKARQEAIAKQKVAEDAAQKVREERLERTYKGKTVFVRRSSGELEGDWKAEQVVGQRIILAKKNPNGGKMVEEVVGKEQVAEFEAWQKEGKETAEKAAIAAREAERNQPPQKPTPEAVKKAVAEAEASAQKIKELKAVEAGIAVNEEALVEMEKTATAAKEAAEIRRKTFQKALETGGKFNTSRIEELNVAEATELIEKYKGDELDLSGLEAINAETVRELAKFKGRSLYLFGLKTIDAATAKELAEFKGSFISLGPKTIDAATAKELAEFKGGSLHLLSLKTIDAATARELAKFKGDSLYLENLETIDAEIARELAGFKGDNLDLDGLEIKSTETARELAKFEGRDLQLGGHIDAAMARELAKFKGTNLSLYRLETIDAETARELARFKGKNLGLGGSIDAGAAKELAKFKGDLAIFCSKAIDAETARELAKFEGSDLSIWLDTIDEGATRELLGFTGRMSVSIKDPESKARFEKAKEARAKEGAEKAENTKKLLAEGKIKEIKSITTKEEAAAIVEWAQKSRDNYTLELSGVETLSEQAAVELAKHNGNIYLNSLKSMDKGTARRLFGGFGGNILELNGLENIEDIAGEISKCRANIIHLNGIKTLSQNAAAELVENQRKETHQAIEMKGLKTIDEGTARELAKSKVDVLDLSGIENINEAMARSFAGFEGRVLSLGIKTIAEGEAGALANFKGKFIHLDGLKSIDKKTAEKLASFKGETIDLNGLESVEGIAAELGKFQGSLLLQGVKKISKEALVELSKVHKKDIEFGKLESIEDIAAEMAGLNVDTLAVRMTELSAGAAEKLATFKGGHLHLSHKLNLSPDAAAKLAQYRGTIWGLNEKSKELMEKAPGRKATISKW